MDLDGESRREQVEPKLSRREKEKHQTKRVMRLKVGWNPKKLRIM